MKIDLPVEAWEQIIAVLRLRGLHTLPMNIQNQIKVQENE
jgi:hypothetical protein